MQQQSALRWRCHPARCDSAKLGLALAVLAAVGALGLVISHSLVVALVLIGAVWTLNAEFFVPTDYVLDGRGVSLRRLGVRRFRPWNQIRTVERVRGGLLLTPFARRRPMLDERRGLLLRCDRQADAVAAFVERHRPAGGRGR